MRESSAYPRSWRYTAVLGVVILALLAAFYKFLWEPMQPTKTAGTVQAPIGEKLELSGTVTRVVKPGAFYVKDSRGEVLVLTKRSDATPKAGEDVKIVGTMRRFDPAKVDEWTGEASPLPDADRLAGQPVVVSEEAVSH